MERIQKIYRISRRALIKLLILISSIILIYKILDVRTLREKKHIVFKLAAVPVGGGVVLREQRIAIIRTIHNISVFSLICPHLGCTLNLTEKIFKCPCHGSEFDFSGKLLKGPANMDLNTLPYKIKGDDIIIYI